jgi:DNA-binding NarL/FixJ family response regulator
MNTTKCVSARGDAAQRRVLIVSTVRAASEALALRLQGFWPDCILAHGTTEDELVTPDTAPHATTLLFDGSASSQLQRLRQFSQALRAPRIVVYGLRDTGEDLRWCARHQVGGLVDRDAPIRELVDAVEAVSEGRHYTSMSLIPRLLQLVAAPQQFDEDHLSRLTDRETQVASMLARGLTYAQIAAELLVSPATIKNHVHNIYRKVRDGGGTKRVPRTPREGISTPPWGPALVADKRIADGD